MKNSSHMLSGAVYVTSFLNVKLNAKLNIIVTVKDSWSYQIENKKTCVAIWWLFASVAVDAALC